MAPTLLALIYEYQRRASEAVRLLKDHLKLENPHEWWLSEVPQTGMLGDTGIHYAFHGMGVTLSSTSWYCGFDFGYAGRYDGFQPDKLAGLAQRLDDQFSDWTNWQKLGYELDKYTRQGLMHQPFLSLHDSQYYFQSNP